ncbi:protein NDRG3 isoform X4 [Eupeodes corollae]|uniref:protein NDRG3 isoform X4 n=1 Tax=Eupeodes corollae TaxID=290404 RepID=UPI00248FEEE7|nr:protein NDRG3 isoform X4 [Eupeodes corollae]
MTKSKDLVNVLKIAGGKRIKTISALVEENKNSSPGIVNPGFTPEFGDDTADGCAEGGEDFDCTDFVDLWTMPVDPMDDIELRSVQLQFNRRDSIVDHCEQKRIPTDKGEIQVAVQGDPKKSAILTYHDLGLNYATSFSGFFNYPEMREILNNFCVYHVTAPGQEDGAPTLPEDYVYPTMDELAAQLLFVMSHFNLKIIIGFGVGAGANILARFAHQNPQKVAGLCLINCVSTTSGWIEWGYQSFNARFLRTKGMTQGVVDYLMWHHFGRNPEERNHDLVQMYKHHFENNVNPANLAMFINSYISRNDLNITRSPPPTPGQQAAITTLKMTVMNITGALSPHVEDTITLNTRLDPATSTWMKISDCAMVLEEQPAKVAEAFRLFLQGEGYVTPLSSPTTPSGASKKTASLFFGNFHQQKLLQQQQQQQQQQKKDLDLENGNAISEFGSSDEMDMDTNVDMDNATVYTGINLNSNKIRITENPLPEPVSC